MKKTLLLALVLLFATLSCKKDDATPTPIAPIATIFCKLNQAVVTGSGLTTYDFTYDAATGNITKYTLSTVAGNDKQVLTQTLTYNKTGQIMTGYQTFAINGKVQMGGGNSTYTYTNGLLTDISYLGTNAATTIPFARKTIKYDANKRMSESVYISGNYTITDKYEYDANGNCTKYATIDTDGYSQEIISTYDTSKNPEQIVAKAIPFDFSGGQPWKINVALTTKSTFIEQTGAKPEVTTAKRSNIKTDAKGYVISATYTSSDGTSSNETYSLADCN